MKTGDEDPTKRVARAVALMMNDGVGANVLPIARWLLAESKVWEGRAKTRMTRRARSLDEERAMAARVLAESLMRAHETVYGPLSKSDATPATTASGRSDKET